MSLDPYSLCPCGSGDKLKFCCHAISGDMTKIERLIRGNQYALALKNLESLHKQHPGNPWIGVHRAAILMGDSQPAEAVEVLQPVVEQHPDHLHAIALLATAAFSADGFELAKPFIHRAFQRCEVAYPELVGNLALGIASAMYGDQCYMAARQHLTLAMRLVSDEHKQSVFVRLLEFDGNRRLPYPMRSVHELARIDGDEELTAEATKARRLSDAGCWRPAAKIFGKLAEANPEHAGLWQNAALCRAWDGDERKAAEAFHQAAELTEDHEDAVELETLAQLLDYNTTDDVNTFRSRSFDVTSTSRLLGRLDEHPRIIRMELSPDEQEDGPVAVFHMLDRDGGTEIPDESTDLDSIANVVAQIDVYDVVLDGADSPVAFLSGEEGEPLDQACRVFSECGGDLVSQGDDEEGDPFKETMPAELSQLSWRWHFPESTPAVVQRALERRKWEQATLTDWVATPLNGLGGKSPQEAAGDESLSVPLDAAVIVLDSYCDRAKYDLQIDTLRERLSLKPPRQIDVTPETTFNTFTVMQLQRLPVEDLSDSQLSSALNRAILIHHGRFLRRILVEAMKRPACAERVEANRVYLTMFELCLEHGDRSEALEYCDRGREAAKSTDKAFEDTLQWELRELSLRLEDPRDDRVAEVLDRLGSAYIPKLPNLRDAIDELLADHGVTPPWAGEETASAVSSGGIWTPESGQQSAAGSKKLWTPGQD